MGSICSVTKSNSTNNNTSHRLYYINREISTNSLSSDNQTTYIVSPKYKDNYINNIPNQDSLSSSTLNIIKKYEEIQRNSQ